MKKIILVAGLFLFVVSSCRHHKNHKTHYVPQTQGEVYYQK